MRRLPWNWRQRIEIVLSPDPLDGTISFILQWMEGKRPFRSPRDRRIGFLVIDPKGHICESLVDDRFQRRGLGSMVYRHALKHFGQLTTEWHDHSRDARYVWDSLIAEYQYKTNFFSGRLTVYNRRRRRTSKKG